MADKHAPEVRRKNMAAVKGKNTKTELLVRRALHGRGFRYGLHRKDLPGKPDVVMPKYKAVIFVNGCFWHGHDCPRFSWPKTRAKFWREKITGNVTRDLKNNTLLLEAGWRVATVWECSLKGKNKCKPDAVADELEHWLLSENPDLSIGTTHRRIAAGLLQK